MVLIKKKKKYSNFFRPDNWVIFDALHKVPLPSLPTLKNDYESDSSEMPRPLIFKRNADA